jgi:metal-responsive CopG/Arc/MetJ family transcriptional regulator
MAKKLLNVMVDQEFIDQLDELAEACGMTRSEVVRCSLASGIAQGRKHRERLKSPVWRALVRLAVLDSGDDAQRQLFEHLTDRGRSPGHGVSA